MLAELINAQHGSLSASTSQRRGLSEHIILILPSDRRLAYGSTGFLYWIQRGLFPYRNIERLRKTKYGGRYHIEFEGCHQGL